MKEATTELRGFKPPETPPAPPQATDNRFTVGADSSVSSRESQQHLEQHSNSEWLIRRILVPTDYSTGSAKALQRATVIANQCHAVLTILHVIDINARLEQGTARSLMEELWSDGSVRMGQLAWSLAGQVEAQTLLEEGLPSDVIVEKTAEFDLLVIA